jgi:glucosamine-6-phosphate deaminase
MSAKSKVEEYFLEKDYYSKFNERKRKVMVIVVDNYVELGQLTALRFLEWVCQNPEGIIALPTGKTPEFFIKWVEYYLSNWENEYRKGILSVLGLPSRKPDLKSLQFFQIDEFFPIHPQHERSFSYFIKKYYVSSFGLNPDKVNYIDTYHLHKKISSIMPFSNTYDVFRGEKVDLSLRVRQATNEIERIQKSVIQEFDNFCQEYEQRIREAGGIGFFVGGIGPDGHIAFNIRGSSHFSCTRLDNINYETQAASATDMGGIEVVKKKAIITIGLSTITYNPEAVAIIIAAGQAKSKVVADAVESIPSVEFPATAIQKLPNSRFYITRSAAKYLTLSEKSIFFLKEKNVLPENYYQKLVFEEALNRNITLKQLKEQPINSKSDSNAIEQAENYRIVPQLTNTEFKFTVQQLIQEVDRKIEKGITIPKNQRILHTGPHHDDIELAYFPIIHHLVRSESNENYFAYCTSGYTAVTNDYLGNCISQLVSFIKNDALKNHPISTGLSNPDNEQEDITGYLNAIAQQNIEHQLFYICSRLARRLISYFSIDSIDSLLYTSKQLLAELNAIEAGRKEPDIYHLMKGWIREFEAELVWAHFGIGMDHIFHMRLPFYSDDIYPRYPNYEKDVLPILSLLERIQPTIITLALDPEGSGPDTHYKALIALAEAIDIYVKNSNNKDLTIWGYRNVWSRFELYETNLIFPTSLNSFAVLHNMFNNCFISQKSASFPSYELDGTFSELAQHIWVEQFNTLIKLLGKDYFYNSKNPMLKRAFGAIFLKEMNYSEFCKEIQPVRRLINAKNEIINE